MRHPPRRRCGHADETASFERKTQLYPVASRDDRALQTGKARELDHGVENLLSA
jgi:hypothetical protein